MPLPDDVPLDVVLSSNVGEAVTEPLLTPPQARVTEL